jgi:hypothetical protein
MLEAYNGFATPQRAIVKRKLIPGFTTFKAIKVSFDQDLIVGRSIT